MCIHKVGLLEPGLGTLNFIFVSQYSTSLLLVVHGRFLGNSCHEDGTEDATHDHGSEEEWDAEVWNLLGSR